MWKILDRPKTFTILEFGSGQGLLSKDILTFIESNYPAFAKQVRYVLIDRIKPFSKPQPKNAEWVLANKSPFKGVTGCIISNELLDSFPVHRFKIQNNKIYEILVNTSPNGFTEIAREIDSTPLLDYLKDISAHNLPDGFQGEIGLESSVWLNSAIASLDRGFILTVDYGATKEDLYSSQNLSGSLRCFYNHTVTGNPYQRIGKQDITSNVNFSALMDIGEVKGLSTLGITTQREFLSNLGMGNFLTALSQTQLSNNPQLFPALSQKEYLANRMAALQLMDPQGLGAFKVLIQSKRVKSPQLSGIHPKNNAPTITDSAFTGLNLPLRDQDRTPLFEGRYPDQALIPDDIWPWSSA
jgi:SAM-dependent MidA family methyltransferase